MVKTYKIGAHISNDPDLILEEQLLLSPGLWKGVNFTADEIIKGINRTNWNDPEVSSILKNHPQKGQLPSADDWIGDLKNIRYLTFEDGVEKEGMYGDAYFYDPVLAKKIVYGHAKLGLSIDSPFMNSSYGATNLSFHRTATVYRPGCKDAYIQLSDAEDNLQMRFVSDELKIQLEGEVDDKASRGNEGEEFSNQPTKEVTLASETAMEEKNIKLSDLILEKKEDIKRVMKEKTSTTSVQLEEATTTPVNTEPVNTEEPKVESPKVEEKSETPTLEPKTPVVETPKVEEKPNPIKEEVKSPVKEEVIDNSKEIGELKSDFEGFKSEMTKLTTAVLELTKPKVEPKEEVKTEPKVEPKVEEKPIKTEEVRKTALSQTITQVEGKDETPEKDNASSENGEKFGEAYLKINSTK